MATEIMGYTDREMRDAEYWRLRDQGVKGMNRYTTHSDLPEPGEIIPDKWKGWNTSIIYVLAVPATTLPPEVAEAEAVLAEIETKVPLTATEDSDILTDMEETPNVLDKQPTPEIPTRFRGPVELPKPSDDSGQRPDAPVDEDIF